MVRLPRPLALGLAASLSLAPTDGVRAQDRQHVVKPDVTCQASSGFEAQGYVIRTVRVDSPFRFLPWIDAGLAGIERDMAAMVGRRYQRAEVLRWADELEDRNF